MASEERDSAEDIATKPPRAEAKDERTPNHAGDTDDDNEIKLTDYRKNKEFVFSIYEKYIEYVRHENTLIKDRSQLFVLSTLIVLTGFAFFISKLMDGNIWPFFGSEARPNANALTIYIFGFILCIFGFFISFAGFQSIMAAQNAQYKLFRQWIEIKIPGTEYFVYRAATHFGLPGILGAGILNARQVASYKFLLTPMHGIKKIHQWGRFLSFSAPFLGVMFWLLVIATILFALIFKL